MVHKAIEAVSPVTDLLIAKSNIWNRDTIYESRLAHHNLQSVQLCFHDLIVSQSSMCRYISSFTHFNRSHALQPQVIIAIKVSTRRTHTKARCGQFSFRSFDNISTTNLSRELRFQIVYWQFNISVKGNKSMIKAAFAHFQPINLGHKNFTNSHHYGIIKLKNWR